VELQGAIPLFAEVGYRPVAISTDDVEGAAAMAQYARTDYPILADPDHAVAESYGVFDLLGDGVAAPAVLLIGEYRVVHWRQVGENIGDRPTVSGILDAILEVHGPPDGS
jgi:peroxiredoxin